MGVNVGIEKRAKKFWQKSAQVAVEIAADGQQDDRHVQINTRRRRTGHRKRRSRNILKIPEARLLVINADPEARKRLKISAQNLEFCLQLRVRKFSQLQVGCVPVFKL